MEVYEKFYRRADSMLNGAIGVKDNKSMLNEDKCYMLQQALEKALKAILIYHGVNPPHTHNIEVLFNLIQQCEVIPQNVYRHELNKLTDYSTQKRYPGEEDEDETTDEDFLLFSAMQHPTKNSNVSIVFNQSEGLTSE